jgi:serine/threonine protein kinase
MAPPVPTGGEADAPEDEPDAPLGDLRILAMLSSGTLRTVYRVESRSSGRLLALKTYNTGVPPHDVERLAREAHLLAALRHPNILEAVAFVDRRLLLTPLLHTTLEAELPGDRDSTALWTRRAALKRWPLARSLRLGLELARALNHCHSLPFPGVRHARVLHRDLRPSNIGLAADGRVVLSDFGQACIWDIGPADAGGAELRCLTARRGCLRYMAPEMMVGAPYNHRVDVYSWALLLWEMCAHETVRAACAPPPPPPPWPRTRSAAPLPRVALALTARHPPRHP